MSKFTNIEQLTTPPQIILKVKSKQVYGPSVGKVVVHRQKERDSSLSLLFQYNEKIVNPRMSIIQIPHNTTCNMNQRY